MIDDPTVSRRALLAAGAVGAGAVALAACSSSSKPGATQPAGTQPAGSQPAASGNDLVKLADVEVGKCVSVKLPDGKPGIVSRPTEDSAVAFSAKCTHMGCTVAPAGSELHCPCHGSKYNALTGAVLQGPAPLPLTKIDVQVVSGEVVASS
jgi:cytochrome b6-f complex iron-sulfur subunit